MYSRVRASGRGYSWPYQPFDDLRARGAEAADEPTVRQVVHRDRRHRGRRGRACRHLHDAGAELDLLGVSSPPRQRRECIGAVGLGGPDRVEAELLGLLDRFERPRRRTRRPVSGVVSELESAMASTVEQRARGAQSESCHADDGRRSTDDRLVVTDAVRIPRFELTSRSARRVARVATRQQGGHPGRADASTCRRRRRSDRGATRRG